MKKTEILRCAQDDNIGVAQSDKTGVDVGELVVFVWDKNPKLRPSFSLNRLKPALLWDKDFFFGSVPILHLTTF